MNKPRGFIHIDRSTYRDALVIGRVRLPLNFIYGLYGIITAVAVAVGIVLVFALPFVPIFQSDGVHYSMQPDFRALIPAGYLAALGAILFVASLLTEFVQWSKRQFELAREEA